jgi:lipopolysaccharide/colanic/teichoic acid biosynthesis glycosyltransferase
MKTDTDIAMPAQKRGALKDSTIHIAVLQIEEVEQSDFVQDNWHFSYFTLESLSFAILENPEIVDAVFIGQDANPKQMSKLSELLNLHNIPFILYTNKYEDRAKNIALDLKVDDYLLGAFSELMMKRILFIKKTKVRKNAGLNNLESAKSIEPMQSIKIWKLKRVSDIILSSIALIALSPILLLIAIIVKLESRGPIFYISKRAGSGYKIFNFYKFRSMRTGADKELKNLAHLNQYSENSTATETVFFKIKDDPRVTRFGLFLRNSSLDELPQLFNVLKGDMSLVGNRPLPLYEAERLTKDQIAWRFLAPAGITGLWQVTKRGNKEMSLDERIHLDMEYAMKNSFQLDMKIIFSTFPALFQKEKV